MVAPTIRAWLTASLVFLGVVLAVAMLTLAWEVARGRGERRSLAGQLAHLMNEGEGSSGAAARGMIFRGEPGEMPFWIRPLVRWVPQLRDIRMLLQQAGLEWSGVSYLVRCAGLALALGLAFLIATGNWLFAVAAALLGSLLPYLYVRRKRTVRLATFQEQLPDAVDLIGRAIRAGHPLSAGFAMVAEETEEPISGEFRQVFEEQRFGLPMDESLLSLADRVPLTDVRIFISAVLIQREVGGNLAEVLDKLSYVVRQRFTTLRQLRVITAQGRMTGYVLAVLPIVTGLVLTLIQREIMLEFVRSSIGQTALLGAAVLQGIGYLWIHRITNIEI
jgi:tight adherence protein B